MNTEEEDVMESLVSVMFCAAPKFPVEMGKEKIFYNIFCLYYPKVDKYIVFFKIYKIHKRKGRNGLYFKVKKSFNLNFTYKEEVFGSLINFYSNFLNMNVLLTRRF